MVTTVEPWQRRGGEKQNNTPLTLRFMAKQDTRRGKNSAVEYKDKQLETRQVCINSV